MLRFPRILLSLFLSLLFFSISSAQTTQPVGQSVTPADSSRQAPSASDITGTGTQNNLPKWLDNTGTLGDSSITEVNGKVGVGTTNPREGFTLFSAGGTSKFFTTEWGSGGTASLGGDNTSGPFLLSHTDSLGRATGNYTGSRIRFGAQGFLFDISPVTAIGQTRSWTTQMVLDSSGRLGLGTTSPTARLQVAGNLRISGTGNGILFPDGSTMTSANLSGATIVNAINSSSSTINAGRLGSINSTGLADAAVTLPKIATSNSAQSGQVLSFDGANMVWAAPSAPSGDNIISAINNAGTQGTINLNRISSVDSTGLADGAVTVSKLNAAAPTASGQVLTYNGTGLSWQTPSSGGSTTVFRFTRTTTCGPFNDATVLDHASINGNSSAMIFVTALIGIDSNGSNTNPSQNVQLIYTGSSGFGSCPAERWLIRGGDVTDGAQFNVMIVGQ